MGGVGADLLAGLQVNEGAYGFVPGAGRSSGSGRAPAPARLTAANLPPPSRAGYTNRGLPRNSASAAAAAGAATPVPADASYGMIPGRMAGLPTASRAPRAKVLPQPASSGRSPPARTMPPTPQPRSRASSTAAPPTVVHAGVLTLTGESTPIPLPPSSNPASPTHPLSVTVTPVGQSMPSLYLDESLTVIRGGRGGLKVSWIAVVEQR